ncbi:hypothetical protein ACFQX6_64220 [Streptosporangium lutulentum]
MAALVGELKAHQHDSNFTAAFFAALGPTGTRTLTTELRRLAEAENSVDVARTAFATALRGGAKVAGFAGIMRAMQETEENDLDGVVDLLRPGAYPTEWLAGMAAPILADGSRVQGKNLATILNLLGKNPAAARLAIGSAAASVRLPPPPSCLSGCCPAFHSHGTPGRNWRDFSSRSTNAAGEPRKPRQGSDGCWRRRPAPMTRNRVSTAGRRCSSPTR